MSSYQIVNPYIEGELDTTVTGSSPEDAAVEAWETLSSYISNNVPSFAFTLEKKNNKSLHHFLVQENIKDGTVGYKINIIKTVDKKKVLNDFKKKIKDLRKKSQALSGGELDETDNKKKKRYKSNDDDDYDIDEFDYYEDIYDRIKMQKKQLYNYQPFYYWWYNPLIYNLNSVYIPTFMPTFYPFLEIQLTSAYTY